MALEECFDVPSGLAHGSSLLEEDVGNDMMLSELLNVPLPAIPDMCPQLWLAGGTSQPPQPQRPALWFLAPETWKIDHQPYLTTTVCDTELVRGHIANIQQWLRQWAATGGCPFIHPHLYRPRLPECAQVAFTTMTSYVHRTEATTDLVLRIVEDQASRLLSDNGVAPEDGGGCHLGDRRPGASSLSSPSSPSSPPSASTVGLGLLEQLARTHALVVYQVISLFDGDIRARHLAEDRQTTLGRWAGQLMESAAQSLTGQLASAAAAAATADAEHPWYFWILSESIRRTWMVASAVEAIYGMLQRGWYPCPGNVMCTTREGLWDASSAADWEERCAHTAGAVGWLAHRADFERFFSEAGAADIDEFSRALMASTFGHDRVRRWERDSGGVQSDRQCG